MIYRCLDTVSESMLITLNGLLMKFLITKSINREARTLSLYKLNQGIAAGNDIKPLIGTCSSNLHVKVSTGFRINIVVSFNPIFDERLF